MPATKKATRKRHRELTSSNLDYSIDYQPKAVRTSDDVSPCSGIIGQKRAIDAFRSGLYVRCAGYNIFFTGAAGT